MRRTAIDSNRGGAASTRRVQTHMREHSHNSRRRKSRSAASHEMTYVLHCRHRVRA